MQNRYAADIGDFSKYALLNALARDNFRLGVVWYFNTVEEPNRDGRFTEYAHLRECDPIIYDKLWDIRESRRRTLREIEKAAVLPCSTLFYREPVPVFANACSTADTRRRQAKLRGAWFEKGMQELSNSDLIYLDPDNGAAGAAVKPYSRRSVKYAFADEISAWLRCGQTVILYQHQQRKPLRMQVEEQLANFARWGSSGWALSFHRNSTRLHFVLPVIEDHRVLLLERSKAFLATRWGTNDHFRLHKRMDQSV